jgi:cell division protease FtsH
MSDQIPDKPVGRGPAGPQLPNRFGRSMFWVFLLVAGVIVLLFFFNPTQASRRTIDPQEFWTYAVNGDIVNTVEIHEKEITGELSERVRGLKPNEPRKFIVNYPYAQADQNFDQRLQQALEKGAAKGGTTRYKYVSVSWWEGLLPHLLLIVLMFLAVWFLLFRRLGAAGNGAGFLGSFGRSRHRLINKDSPKVTFDDVAGIEEAKDEVQEIIEFLRNPRKFQRLGGRVPRGVLLVGEPGCGKTLMAKAIAGEAEVPFFSISGSDFIEMFVGVGASRVRDLFKQAKDSAPCIIFLDEIDAVGRRRINDLHGGGQESAQTLNAILVEMDGFDTSDQVIVIAATNRLDILDPALTRPGRFDRQINVPLPDLKGRYEILGIYVNKVKCGLDVDLNRLARGTPMFSGADLEALVNEAAIAATMANKEFVEMADMEEARDKVRWGRARKSRVIDEREKEMTAYHEAGHALVQFYQTDADPLHKVSIIPRGDAAGATFSLPEKDRYMYTRRYCEALIRVAMAGRIAEEMFCGDIDSGAASDIRHATEVARKMVMDWGMSAKLGFVRYSTDERKAVFPEAGKEYSERTAEVIDQEIKAIVDAAEAETRRIIQEHRDELDRLAKALLKYETLSADEVRQIIEGQSLDKPTVGDLLDREHARTAPPKPDPSAKPDFPPYAQPGTQVP